MPALAPTEYYGRITWLGMTPDRAVAMVSQPVTSVDVDYAGFAGEGRAGLTRLSCPRVTSQHPKGTEIRNARQISAVSAEELALIARDLELDALDPTWLGASMVIEGLPDFTFLPPSSRLQAENGTCLVVDMENRPCHIVSREVEKNRPGHGAGFKTAAKDRRGVTMWVERPGQLKVGDMLRLHSPAQRLWQPQGPALL